MSVLSTPAATGSGERHLADHLLYHHPGQSSPAPSDHLLIEPGGSQVTGALPVTTTAPRRSSRVCLGHDFGFQTLARHASGACTGHPIQAGPLRHQGHRHRVGPDLRPCHIDRVRTGPGCTIAGLQTALINLRRLTVTSLALHVYKTVLLDDPFLICYANRVRLHHICGFVARA